MKKKVILCMFLRNEEKYVRETLISILNQTYINFDLVIMDDNSEDNTKYIIEEVTKNDMRVKYIRNNKRKGYGYCYYNLFKFYATTYKYMAWVSGHDVYEKTWLEECFNIIKEDSSISVVYPINDRIDENSNFIREENRKFSALDEDPFLRLKGLLNKGTNFGQIIYGLFDVEKVKKAGITRSLNLADTVLIWEISIYGKIFQLNKKLWHFRFDYFNGNKHPDVAKIMAKRQMKNRFAKPALYLKLPWPILNSIVIFFNYFFKLNCGIKNQLAGLICGFYYFLKYRKYI